MLWIIYNGPLCGPVPDTQTIVNNEVPEEKKYWEFFIPTLKHEIRTIKEKLQNISNFVELLLNGWTDLNDFFCVCSSGFEHGLDSQLDPVFVETLDKCFENVCELDLIFHADAAHQVLDELVMGGMVLQTNMADILCRLHEQNKMQKAEAGISAAPARAVSAVKSMNLPQQLRDMKLPDLPQAIKDLKF
ncbi:hypothetical protein K1T71_014096 [Dendrolimus kikuchii]|uniref:Uncharacterized protein n=1 Tax=Dendrolimus kikuchii TaxID=765133 RepID=A0ACC1CF19_9NEOP|nr:hypothetical protein K1T71_014096 [Dendrolimus kikuchii]